MTDFFEFAVESMPALLEGTVITLQIWIVCIVLGGILGVFLALARVYGNRFLYAASTTYIEIFRGTPQLVQMFIIYLGLPDIGIVLRPVVAAMVAIGLNTAAYQAEYFRGAIQSVQQGQMKAARSIGMSRMQAIFHVILPQALRMVIPSWSNEAILELKMTSIAFAISVVELMAQAQTIGFRTFRYFEIFVLAGAIYYILVSVISTLLDLLSAKLHIPGLTMKSE